MLKLLERWPVVRQLRTRSRGTGVEAMTERTRTLRPKIDGCKQTKSICPYCGVGCGQVIYHKDNSIVQIEGDPDSPVSRGRLCPKGADTMELHTHADRLMTVKYRRPYSERWEELPLETAMDMIAERMWQTREESFQETGAKGDLLMHTTKMAHLGGATLDNEENYLIKKLFTGGMGMVCVSNQARI
jgi:formate dehydrogenase major subunit